MLGLTSSLSNLNQVVVYVEDADRPSSWQIVIDDGKRNEEKSKIISLDLLNDEVR